MVRWLTLVVAMVVLHAPAAEAFQRGANLTGWWHNDYLQPTLPASAQRLRSTGADQALLLVTWYMRDAHDARIAPDPRRSPSDASLRRAIGVLRRQGLKVSLKPHVDCQDGTWRATIAPQDRTRWWADYRAMILHFARLAARTRLDTLVLGTELVTMTGPGDTARWRALIAEVRRAYRGRLTYAADKLDEAEQIGFWPQLDYIGLNAYLPLSANPLLTPTTAELVRAWTERGYLRRAQALSVRYRKPLLITEFGYGPLPDAAAAPWGSGSTHYDPGAQARAYDAFLRVWGHLPWVAGTYLWDWPAALPTRPRQAASFTPYGKPAEAVLRRHYHRRDLGRP